MVKHESQPKSTQIQNRVQILSEDYQRLVRIVFAANENGFDNLQESLKWLQSSISELSEIRDELVESTTGTFDKRALFKLTDPSVKDIQSAFICCSRLVDKMGATLSFNHSQLMPQRVIQKSKQELTEIRQLLDGFKPELGFSRSLEDAKKLLYIEDLRNGRIRRMIGELGNLEEGWKERAEFNQGQVEQCAVYANSFSEIKQEFLPLLEGHNKLIVGWHLKLWEWELETMKTAGEVKEFLAAWKTRIKYAPDESREHPIVKLIGDLEKLCLERISNLRESNPKNR